ncbi:MAG: hypothetical protein KAS47_02470 [Candidatus Heimdallarchaeota archaeon]|nr:hypothetical protein [Candidatus Heimdallarchaeota archaeon]
MNNQENIAETSTTKTKRNNSSNKTFLIGLSFWSIIFILIPVIIFAFQGDWIVTFSITSKVGIVFVCLGCILLSAKGTFKVVSRGGVTAPIDYEDEDEGDVVLLKEKQTINYWEILLMGRVWMLLWGFMYLLPLAFGVPFIV